MNETYYALRFPDGCFVYIDPSSGGYPGETNIPCQAMFWQDEEDAMIYRDKFRDLDLRLWTVEMTFAPEVRANHGA